MKLEEMKKCLEGMTEEPWHAKNDNALNQWLVYPAKERLLRWSDGKIVGPDEPRLYPIEDTEWNAKGIAMLRNHAEDLLDLVQTVKGLVYTFKIKGEENTKLKDIIARIERVEP